MRGQLQMIVFECKKLLANRNKRLLVILYTLILFGFVLIQRQTLDRQVADELRLSSSYDDAYAKSEMYWQSSADSWRKSVDDPEKYLGHTVSLDTAKATLFVAEAKVIECRMLQQAYRNLTAALEKTNRSAIAQARLEVARAQCFSYGYSNEHYDSWADAMSDYGVGVSERIADFRSYANYSRAETAYMQNELAFLERVAKGGGAAAISSADMTGANALYQIMRRVLPWLLPLYIALLLHDAVSGERASGAERLLLLQPVGRGRIYLVRYAVNCVFAMGAVILPLIAVFAAACLLNGPGSWSYPMLADVKGLMGFDALPLHTDEYAKALELHSDYGFVEQYAMGFSPYSPWDASRSLLMATPNPALEYVPLGEYLLMSLPLWLLNICWMTALVQIASCLCRDWSGSIGAALLLAGGCLAYPQPDGNMSLLARMPPPLYLRPFEQLSGIGASTVLMGEIVALETCAILAAAGALCYCRRDSGLLKNSRKRGI